MLRIISRYYDEELASRILTKGVDLHFLAILSAAAISILFWEFLPSRVLLGWFALLAVIEVMLAGTVGFSKKNLQNLETRNWLFLFGLLHVCVSIVWGSFAILAAIYLNIWQCMIVLAFLYLVLVTPYSRLTGFYPVFALGILAKTLIVLGTLTLNIEFEWRYVLSVILFLVAAVSLLIRGRQDAITALRALRRDKLTGLPNKKAFEAEVIKKTSKQDRYGIVFINIRQEGQLGFEGRGRAWEAAILHVAEKLRLFISRDNYIARYSEQNFAVVILGQDCDYYEEEASKMLRIIGDGVRFEDDFLPIEITAGIAAYPEDSTDFHNLLQKSQLAANLPPEFEGEGVVRYQPDVDAKLNRALEIKSELDNAIASREFSLFYQPKIDLKSGKACGAEALIRWNSSKFGRVGPDEFIPIVEESGHIIELGEWVIQQAARDLRAFKTDNKFSLAVNVSIAQFASGALMRVFEKAVQGLPENRSLEIEVTESIIMNDAEIVKQKIKEFYQMGIKVALDDFGTGYSSLRYITELAINKIKIDQSFISKIPADPMQNAIVQAIITLSQAFNVEVIAEGIETEEQARALKEWRCNTVQGYLYGKPMPINEFNEWLQSHA